LEARFQGEGVAPCQYIDTTRKAIECSTICRSRPKYDASMHFDPHFEEVRSGVEPWWMARWKARAEFLLSVIELLFYLLWLRRYKAKRVKTRSLQEWVGHFEPKFQGEGVVPGEYFFGFYRTRHILLSNGANCTVLRAAVLTQYRRVTDGRTDGRTDGITVANTALAMRALRAL